MMEKRDSNIMNAYDINKEETDSKINMETISNKENYLGIVNELDKKLIINDSNTYINNPSNSLL